MRQTEINATLTKLLQKMEIIDAKVSQLPHIQIQMSGRLLPTLIALKKIGSGTASQISRITQRSRAFESKNLNELCAMGVLSKESQGHMKIFAINGSNTGDKKSENA